MSGRFTSSLVAAIGGALLAAAPVAAQTVAPAAPQPASALPAQDPGFAAWLANFRLQALAAGVRAETLDAILPGLRYNPRVVGFDRSQPDDSRPGSSPRFSAYIAARLDPLRVRRGRQLRSDLAASLSSIEARYGVPANLLLGIWGMETNYGNFVGDFDLVRSLASLAYEGRRRELFTRELIAALQIIDRGVLPRQQLIGSWAGATGQPQFLPTSYLAYAVDHDGDGRPDIWRSEADALASIANYLASVGWKRGQSWGMPVLVPPALERSRLRDLVRAPSCPNVKAKHSRWIPIREWRALGVVPASGGQWPADDVLATLIEPDGPGNGGYLTYGNYRALLDYNCANFYALSVALLADAIG